jgi:hypothetical protein
VSTCEQLVKNCQIPPFTTVFTAFSGFALKADRESGGLISVPQGGRLRIKETSRFPGDTAFPAGIVPRSNYPSFPSRRLKSRYFTPKTSLN